MPPEKHALLSASSASRWLKCTAAPRFEEHLPERTSEYAEEGRLAHAICELKTLKKFTVMTSRTYTTRLNKLKKDPLYSEEMDKTSDLYIEHLTEQAMLYDSTPTVAAEVQVDFGEYVPEGFGTCDNVMIGGDALSITDYKHGKGVPVSAVGNPQMRLYALGALKRYAPVFGDAIKKIRMSIDQPRLDSYTTDTITVEELLAWGESIKPIAQKAFSGLGEFVPGDHCRFCRGKAQCRARANTNTALEDFKDCVPAASVPPDTMVPQEFSHIGPHGNEVHPLLSDAEIGDLLIRGKELVAWYKDLEEYATKALLDGKPIEGWKLVAGRSIRTFTDQDAAIQAAIAAGYDEALLYQGSTGALINMGALDMGIPEEDLPDIVSRWREANKRIRDLWYSMDNAAVQVITQGGSVGINGLLLAREYDYNQGTDCFTIQLPSGRKLYYVSPGIGENQWGNPSISYMGMDQKTKRWKRIETYGGKLVENCVQAIARDCLADTIERLEASGLPVVFHIHDEVVIDIAPWADEDTMLDTVVNIMRQPIPRAADLPLNADGWVGTFFRKD